MQLADIGSNPLIGGLMDMKGVHRVLCGEKTVTDAGVNLFDIPMPAGAHFGAMLFWTVIASDGTDVQARCGVSTIASVNKAGVYTDQVTTLAGMQAVAASSGTLTVAVTVVDGTNKITIVFTPTGSLTETTPYKVYYTLVNMSARPVNVL